MQRLLEYFKADTQNPYDTETLLNQLKSGDAHIIFEPKQLVEIINTAKNPEIRCIAYGVLIAKGSLGQLQQLEHLIDFNFREHPTTSYMSTAVIDGRDDVLKWLRSKNEFMNLTETDKMELVLHAVQSKQVKILKLLVGSEQDGGFGFPIDFTHRGLSPVKLAVRHESYSILYLLTAAQKTGGFGLSIDKESLKLIEKDNRFFMSGKSANHQGKPAYHRAKPGRQHSFIEMKTRNASDGSVDVEKYFPQSALGSGRCGSVRLFVSDRNPEHKLAVKQPIFSPEMEERVSLFQEIDDIDHEVAMTARANNKIPARFFGIKHYIESNPNRDDFRFVMPYFPGESLVNRISRVQSVGEFLKIVIAIANALQDIHDQDMVHVDIKPQNILIEDIDVGSELSEIKVHIIDYALSKWLGEMHGNYGDRYFQIPPEIRTGKTPAQPSSDVFSFACMVLICTNYLKEADKKIMNEFTDHHYDGVLRLMVEGVKDKPSARPQLSEVIADLEKDLAAWRLHQQTQNRLNK